MRKMKYIIAILLLFMVIGFATVTVSLSITGNAKITSDVDDFKVYFSDVRLNNVQDLNMIKSETEISFDLSFAKVGSTETISYDITNESRMFDASVTISCTNGNEYLSVINSFDTSNLLALNTRTGTLVLKKLKSNANANDINNTITCTINATPVERTEEAVEVHVHNFEDGTCTCGAEAFHGLGYANDSDDREIESTTSISYLTNNINESFGAGWNDDTGRGNLIFKWNNGGTIDIFTKNDTITLHENVIINAFDDFHYMEFTIPKVFPDNTKLMAFNGCNEENGCEIINNEEEGSIVAPFPNNFFQEQNQEPSFLNEYSYMYSISTITNNSTNNYFRNIPSTFRFIITNMKEQEINIEKVTIKAVDENGQYHPVSSSKVIFTTNEEVTFEGTHEEIITTISSSLLPDSSYIAYSMALPLDNAEAFEGKNIQCILTTFEGTEIVAATLSDDILASINPNAEYNWGSGTSYTIRINIT